MPPKTSGGASNSHSSSSRRTSTSFRSTSSKNKSTSQTLSSSLKNLAKAIESNSNTHSGSTTPRPKAPSSTSNVKTTSQYRSEQVQNNRSTPISSNNSCNNAHSGCYSGSSSSYDTSSSGVAGAIASIVDTAERMWYHKLLLDRVLNGTQYYKAESGSVGSNGNTLKPGYYDENENYYQGIADYSSSDNKFKLREYECEYCGSHVSLEWEAGAYPRCEHCGAELTQVIYDKEPEHEEKTEYIEPFDAKSSNDDNYTYSNSYSTSNSSGPSIGTIILLSLSAFILGIPALLSLSYCIRQSSPNNNLIGPIPVVTESHVEVYEPIVTESHIDTEYNGTLADNELYNPVLGRVNKYYEEYGSFYDEETDSYYCVSSSDTWQYWFEGYSNNYDSGWMEYDYNDGNWYIEDNGEWLLVDDIDYSTFWHFTEDE